MQIKLETKEEYKKRVDFWHKKFAWMPTRFDGGFVWLGYYERKVRFWTFGDPFWEYRLMDNKK